MAITSYDITREKIESGIRKSKAINKISKIIANHILIDPSDIREGSKVSAKAIDEASKEILKELGYV